MWNLISLQLILVIILFILLVIFWRIRRKLLRVYQSDTLGLIEVWEKYNHELVLTINKYSHGISTHDKSIVCSYWYVIAQEALGHVYKRKDAEVLILGLGANTSSRIIDQQNPKVHQTIIEIDRYIIQACRDFFHLNEMRNATVVRGDAYKLIDVVPNFKNKFDVIVVDIFTGIPPYVSTKTNQSLFIQKLLKWLKHDGMLIFNRPANIKTDRVTTDKLFTHLTTLFQEVRWSYIDDPRGYQNDILTVTKIR